MPSENQLTSAMDGRLQTICKLKVVTTDKIKLE